MDLWTILLNVLILLSAAMLLGALMDRLKQSPILGYLIAGTILGPNAFKLMPSPDAVEGISELGVALLLFTIGLEFSWRRLRKMGAIALGGGTLQIIATITITALICMAWDMPPNTAIVIGAIAALSSTACVLRILATRAEIESIHGRNALGILLMQDIAVVPLVLIVAVLGTSGGDPTQTTLPILHIAVQLGRAFAIALLMVAALFIILNYIVPRLLNTQTIMRNRDLPVLLAMVTAVGAALLSHKLGLSAGLGAFIAGILLAESPFATQVRADVAPLRTLFVTLFFSSIGMLANPIWIYQNAPLVAATVLAIVVGKTVITATVARLFRVPLGPAVATALCLAQVGEFSFVLATSAHQSNLVDDFIFDLLVASTIATLFLTPYLVALAPKLARVVANLSLKRDSKNATPNSSSQPIHANHIIIVGFGPAGQRIAESLLKRENTSVFVIEQNTVAAAIARQYGFEALIGDATRAEVLERVHVATASIVAVTLPEPDSARQVIAQVRSLSPKASIVARARYHVYQLELVFAGAHVVIDEEREVGKRMAASIRKMIHSSED